jgi:hypothetical protein
MPLDSLAAQGGVLKRSRLFRPDNGYELESKQYNKLTKPVAKIINVVKQFNLLQLQQMFLTD